MKINWNASKIESKGVIAGDEFISKSWKINASKIFLIMNMIWFCQDTNCHSQWHKCYDHEKISELKYLTWVKLF